MAEICAQGRKTDCGAESLAWVYNNLALEMQRQMDYECPADGRDMVTAYRRKVIFQKHSSPNLDNHKP